MSLTPAMIDALIAAGGTVEQLGAMVKADLADQEARKASKRVNNAERQQRFRDKRKSRKDNARNALLPVTPPIEEDHTPGSHISPSGENENKPRSKRAAVCARPDDVPDELWEAWVKHRGKHKADTGQTTIDAYRREAGEVGWTLEQALTEQIQRGWRGFKAKWVKDDDRGPQRNSFSGQGRTSDLGREIAAEYHPSGGVVDLVPRLSAPGRTYG